MPRDGGGIMSWPAGTNPTDGEDIDAATENAFLNDLLADLNAARPITSGGTGATSAAAALTNLGAMSKTSPQLGGILDTNANQVRWSKGADVASAAALALGTDGNVFDITGTTAITSINTLAIGTVVVLHFDAVLTLTHHATDLILPSGANITTAADDEAIFYEYATGDWRCLVYLRATGESIVSPASLTQDLDANGNLVKLSKGADVASAASLTLGTDGNYFDITGTTTITSIATLGVGIVVRLHFDAALTLTHHATDLVLPGAANITTAAGDEATFVEYATGDWRCVNYQVAATAPGGPGTIVQSIYAETTTPADLTTALPYDNTIPQNTEGDEVLTATITPTSASNNLRVRFVGFGTKSGTAPLPTCALFRDSTANAKAATANSGYAINHGTSFTLEYQESAGSVSATTYKIRIGQNSGTFYFLKLASGTNAYGGVGRATMVVEEIAV